MRHRFTSRRSSQSKKQEKRRTQTKAKSKKWTNPQTETLSKLCFHRFQCVVLLSRYYNTCLLTRCSPKVLVQWNSHFRCAPASLKIVDGVESADWLNIISAWFSSLISEPGWRGEELRIGG